jgi:hypothetical protein
MDLRRLPKKFLLRYSTGAHTRPALVSRKTCEDLNGGGQQCHAPLVGHI